MARKRMISAQFVLSDAFRALPVQARLTYFNACLLADDDGVVDNISTACHMADVETRDGIAEVADSLCTARFMLRLPSASTVYVIKHWWLHNQIKGDRYKPTCYDLDGIYIKPDKSYTDDPSKGTPVAAVEARRPATATAAKAAQAGEDDEAPAPPKKRKAAPEPEENALAVPEKPKKAAKPRKTKLDASLEALATLIDGKPYSDDVIAGLTEWVEYRAEMGKPMTEIAIKKVIKLTDDILATQDDGYLLAAIDYSIRNGWQSIYPDKNYRPAQQQARGGAGARWAAQQGVM